MYPGLYTEVSRYVSWIEKSLQQLENKNLILWPRQSWCPLRSNECDGFIEISWEQCEKMTQTINSLSTHVFQIKTGEKGNCDTRSLTKTKLKSTKFILRNAVQRYKWHSSSKQECWYQMCCRILSSTLYTCRTRLRPHTYCWTSHPAQRGGKVVLSSRVAIN